MKEPLLPLAAEIDDQDDVRLVQNGRSKRARVALLLDAATTAVAPLSGAALAAAEFAAMIVAGMAGSYGTYALANASLGTIPNDAYVQVLADENHGAAPALYRKSDGALIHVMTGPDNRDRALHHGEQAIATIAGLQAALDARIGWDELADATTAESIGFQAAGSTPSSRNIAAKAREIVSVDDYYRPDLGDVDYAPAVNRAIMFLGSIDGGGDVYIPFGRREAASALVHLDKHHVNIAGPGWLMNATIRVGKTFAEINGVAGAMDLGGRIACNLMCTEPSDDRNAIEVQYTRNFSVSGRIVNYNNGVKAIAMADGQVFGQMVARLNISKTSFINCRSDIVCERNQAATDRPLQYADWTILDVLSLGSDTTPRTIRNLDLEGLDGLTCDNCYFFMPGRHVLYMGKRQNVRLRLSCNINLGDNQYFEAGAEAIEIWRCQRVTVTGGVIAGCGQVIRSSAIKIHGGDVVGAQYCQHTIGGITGDRSSRFVVEILDNSSYVVVNPFQFSNPGVMAGEYYYGTDPAPATIYGVYAGPSTSYISADATGFTRGAGALTPALLEGSNSSSEAIVGGVRMFALGVGANKFCHISSSDRNISWGATAPNGVETRLPASLYFRQDGGLGITAWLKENGYSNADWLALQLRRYGATDPAMSLGSLQTGIENFNTTYGRPRWYTGTGSDWYMPPRRVAVPASAVSAGQPGDYAVDATHRYDYIGDGSTHAWVRCVVTTW